MTERVYMTIDLDAIWARYHDGATTPDDVRRLLLAYDGTAEQLKQTNAALEAESAARQASDADATQLRAAARAFLHAGSYVERFTARAELEVLVVVERPGMVMITAIAQLQHAWDTLSDCSNEFEPDDMGACAEYRDALDTAILAVLATMKGK